MEISKLQFGNTVGAASRVPVGSSNRTPPLTVRAAIRVCFLVCQLLECYRADDPICTPRLRVYNVSSGLRSQRCHIRRAAVFALHPLQRV